MNSYRALPEALRPIADEAARFLRSDRGLGVFKVETPIADELDRPTLHVVARSHHYVCIEPSERNGFPQNVESFVNDCARLGVPVQLFVAVASGNADAEFDRMLKRASSLGVGLLEIGKPRVTVRSEPVLLSLQGLRRVDRAAFPSKYRQALVAAEQTFLQGNPVKGCAAVYDEVEALSRRLAEHTYQRGFWKSGSPNSKPIALKFGKDSWVSVMKALLRNLDGATLPSITEGLVHAVIALAPHRNESGHKVQKTKDLVRRDSQLRTRFEHAVDIFKDLIAAARPFRL